MITKEQAMALRHGQELHFGVCKSTTGPRGGVKVTQTRVRVSGMCQTWKTRPEDFRVPVKHGMYDNGEIVPSNAHSFHLESDCPLNSTHEWEVIVGNIGSVYLGTNEQDARAHYNTYVEQSTDNYGRASGESVTLMRDNHIYTEHIGTVQA